MRQKTVVVILGWLFAPALFCGQALAQAPAAEPTTTCIPTAEQAAQVFGARGRAAVGLQGFQPAAQQTPRELDHNSDPGRRRRGRKVDESLARSRQQR